MQAYNEILKKNVFMTGLTNYLLCIISSTVHIYIYLSKKKSIICIKKNVNLFKQITWLIYKFN